MILFFLSFFLVAFGQGSLIPKLGFAAGTIGYALFWFAALKKFQGKKERFFVFFVWYALVLGVQISWLCSTKYMGFGIFAVYGFIVLFFAGQFGALSLFFSDSRKEMISLKNCFGIAGLWTLLEGSRLFLFSGFPWNPSGLALAASSKAIQFSALFGVYGLSFWVIFVNAFALYSLSSWKRGAVFVTLALLPYGYGISQEFIVRREVQSEQVLSVALVQTGILPEQKDLFLGKAHEYISPLLQWERIWKSLPKEKKIDLIVLPEAAVPFIATHPAYSLERVEAAWRKILGSTSSFPPFKAPFAFRSEQGWKVTNVFLAQALANHFDARLIGGFLDRDEAREYNAAFDLRPGETSFERYEKRVLVPMGEYVPFSQNLTVSNFLASQFGVADSFTMGKEAKVFGRIFPIGISICAEETYSHLIRDLRLKGARIFINLTNDIWFPGTHLPETHLQHGCIRSAENGTYSLRSCNSGITAVVDCFGRVVHSLDPSESDARALFVTVPVRSFKTPYSFWGDGVILILSGLFSLFSFFSKKYTRLIWRPN